MSAKLQKQSNLQIEPFSSAHPSPIFPCFAKATAGLEQNEDLWDSHDVMDWKDFQKKAIAFRDARDWKQFHNPKDMALSLVLEAAEVMEHFQWKNEKEMNEYVKNHKSEIGDELADVLVWVATISHDLGIDMTKAYNEKMKKNGKKYPVEKAKGKHAKYTEL